MGLQLRQSYSFVTRLLLLTAVFVKVQSGYAAPHFQQRAQQGGAEQVAQQSAGTSFSTLQSQAEPLDLAETACPQLPPN